MITEDYVSFETAKLLKDKGFNEITLDSYRANGQLRGEYKYCNYPCPTLQMAMKWLREKCKLFIGIELDSDKYNWYIVGIGYITNTMIYICDDMKNTYEQACEAAIKYCLENLI